MSDFDNFVGAVFNPTMLLATGAQASGAVASILGGSTQAKAGGRARGQLYASAVQAARAREESAEAAMRFTQPIADIADVATTGIADQMEFIQRPELSEVSRIEADDAIRQLRMRQAATGQLHSGNTLRALGQIGAQVSGTAIDRRQALLTNLANAATSARGQASDIETQRGQAISDLKLTGGQALAQGTIDEGEASATRIGAYGQGLQNLGTAAFLFGAGR